MINVVVPFSRPANAGHVRRNLSSQCYQDFRAVVVENGAAVGSWVPAPGETVLHSPAHWSPAKNVALDWVGSGPVAIMDDDDWYGPLYLARVAEAFAKGHTMTARARFQVRLQDGSMWHRPAEATAPHGSTLAFVLGAETPRFERCVDEEIFFVHDMQSLGHRLHLLGNDGQFVYRRSPDSAFRCSDAELVQRWGLRQDCGAGLRQEPERASAVAGKYSAVVTITTSAGRTLICDELVADVVSPRGM